MITFRYWQILKGALAVGLAWLVGCHGYQNAFEYNQLPNDVQTIAIPFFKNETFESNIEAFFTTATMNEFIKNKQFAVVSEGGDATLSGIVKEFRIVSIAYSAQDRARQYRAYVTIELTLRRNSTGEVLWRNPQMKHDEEYAVSENVAYTEDNKDLAIERIARELAERVYEEIVFGY